LASAPGPPSLPRALLPRDPAGAIRWGVAVEDPARQPGSRDRPEIAAVRAGRVVVAPYIQGGAVDRSDPLDQQPPGVARIGQRNHLPGSGPTHGTEQEPVARLEGGEHAVAGDDHPPQAEPAHSQDRHYGCEYGYGPR